MVDKPPVELRPQGVCRTWHGISVDDAIPKRFDQFKLLFHRELTAAYLRGVKLEYP
jgi:hypothetical protein